MRRAVHRELLNARRQRDRPTDLRAGALGRGNDLARRRIEDAVIERLEPDPDILAVIFLFSFAGVARLRGPLQLRLTR
jgi:hypothetical protein